MDNNNEVDDTEIDTEYLEEDSCFCGVNEFKQGDIIGEILKANRIGFYSSN